MRPRDALGELLVLAAIVLAVVAAFGPLVLL